MTRSPAIDDRGAGAADRRNVWLRDSRPRLTPALVAELRRHQVHAPVPLWSPPVGGGAGAGAGDKTRGAGA